MEIIYHLCVCVCFLKGKISGPYINRRGCFFNLMPTYQELMYNIYKDPPRGAKWMGRRVPFNNPKPGLLVTGYALRFNPSSIKGKCVPQILLP